MRRRFLGTSLLLIGLGVGLGLAARAVLGPPESENPFPRRYSEPVRFEDDVAPDLDAPIDDVLDSPLDLNDGASNANTDSGQVVQGGIVPPLNVPVRLDRDRARWWVDDRPFDHDERAIFEPHGTKVCASGCALSRHPTRRLTRQRFEFLLDRLNSKEGDTSASAWDELVYYGHQARELLSTCRPDRLSLPTRQRLESELWRDHVRVEIRIVGEDGTVRSWLPSTRVPLDRRHVFDMETDGLQPLVTSGTVKRVGLDYLWVRL